MLRTMISGFLMAMADSVPGVSGSTIALLLGFYDDFIISVHNVFAKDIQARTAARSFLLRLGAGWIFGMAVCVVLLKAMFVSHIYTLSSLFIGLTLSSMYLLFEEERISFRHIDISILFLFIGILSVWFVTAVRISVSSHAMESLLPLSFPMILYLLFSGFAAIVTMLLPGISGSTMLLSLGMYIPIISAAREVLGLNFAYAIPLFFFAIGVAAGISMGSTVIRKLLSHYRKQMNWLIMGLLAGSLYAITNGPAALTPSNTPLTTGTINPLAITIGILIPFLLKTAARAANGGSTKYKAQSTEVPK